MNETADKVELQVVPVEKPGKPNLRSAACTPSGNDLELVELAVRDALVIGAGHAFIVFLGDRQPGAGDRPAGPQGAFEWSDG